MKAKSYIPLLVAAACMMAITSCNDDQDIQPSDANNTEQENVADSTQSKGEESTIPLYIPLKKNASGYEPVVTPISSKVFTQFFSNGYWWENEYRFVYEDGTTSEPIRWMGGSSTLFTQANGETLLMAYDMSFYDYDWREHLTSFPYTYDEQTNVFSYGSGKPHQTFTVLSINADEMRCTMAPDENLIKDFEQLKHALQYVVFKHYTEKEVGGL